MIGLTVPKQESSGVSFLWLSIFWMFHVKWQVCVRWHSDWTWPLFGIEALLNTGHRAARLGSFCPGTCMVWDIIRGGRRGEQWAGSFKCRGSIDANITIIWKKKKILSSLVFKVFQYLFYLPTQPFRILPILPLILIQILSLLMDTLECLLLLLHLCLCVLSACPSHIHKLRAWLDNTSPLIPLHTPLKLLLFHLDLLDLFFINQEKSELSQLLIVVIETIGLISLFSTERELSCFFYVLFLFI